MKIAYTNIAKIPVFLSLFFLVLSISIFFFLYNTIQANNKLFEDTQTKWQEATAKREGMDSLSRALREAEGDRATLNSHFILSSDVVPFLDTLEKLAPTVGAKSEVTVIDVSGDGSALTAGVKATGTFESLYKYLTLLENSPYELEFTTLDLQKTGGAEGGREWSLTLKIKLLTYLK
jgi:hypothetical protein